MDEGHPVFKPTYPAELPATWEEFEKIKEKNRIAEQLFWAAQPQSVRDEELRRHFSDNPPGLSLDEWLSIEPLRPTIGSSLEAYPSQSGREGSANRGKTSRKVAFENG